MSSEAVDLLIREHVLPAHKKRKFQNFLERHGITFDYEKEQDYVQIMAVGPESELELAYKKDCVECCGCGSHVIKLYSNECKDHSSHSQCDGCHGSSKATGQSECIGLECNHCGERMDKDNPKSSAGCEFGIDHHVCTRCSKFSVTDLDVCSDYDSEREDASLPSENQPLLAAESKVAA